MPTQTEILLAQLNNTLDLLYEKISVCYNYMPYIYTQLNVSSDTTTGLFTIEFNGNEIPQNSFVYMLPRMSSIDETTTNKNKLKVIFARGSGGTITSCKIYDIKMEDERGGLISATRNAIASGRVCTFRFVPNNDSICILVNHPMYGSITVNNLNVTGTATFDTVPQCSNTTEQSSTEPKQLTLLESYNDLVRRVEDLENKIIIGTDDIEDVLDSLPEGSIYIQTELGESDD